MSAGKSKNVVISRLAQIDTCYKILAFVNTLTSVSSFLPE